MPYRSRGRNAGRKKKLHSQISKTQKGYKPRNEGIQVRATQQAQRQAEEERYQRYRDSARNSQRNVARHGRFGRTSFGAAGGYGHKHLEKLENDQKRYVPGARHPSKKQNAMAATSARKTSDYVGTQYSTVVTSQVPMKGSPTSGHDTSAAFRSRRESKSSSSSNNNNNNNNNTLLASTNIRPANHVVASSVQQQERGQTLGRDDGDNYYDVNDDGFEVRTTFDDNDSDIVVMEEEEMEDGYGESVAHLANDVFALGDSVKKLTNRVANDTVGMSESVSQLVAVVKTLIKFVDGATTSTATKLEQLDRRTDTLMTNVVSVNASLNDMLDLLKDDETNGPDPVVEVDARADKKGTEPVSLLPTTSTNPLLQKPPGAWTPPNHTRPKIRNTSETAYIPRLGQT